MDSTEKRVLENQIEKRVLEDQFEKRVSEDEAVKRETELAPTSRPVRPGLWPEDSIEKRVIEVVAEQLGVSKDQVTPDARIINDLGADSLDVVELVMALEEKFDMSIPDDAAEKIQTVGQVIDYIKKLQSAS